MQHNIINIAASFKARGFNGRCCRIGDIMWTIRSGRSIENFSTTIIVSSTSAAWILLLKLTYKRTRCSGIDALKVALFRSMDVPSCKLDYVDRSAQQFPRQAVAVRNGSEQRLSRRRERKIEREIK